MTLLLRLTAVLLAKGGCSNYYQQQGELDIPAVKQELLCLLKIQAFFAAPLELSVVMGPATPMRRRICRAQTATSESHMTNLGAVSDWLTH